MLLVLLIQCVITAVVMWPQPASQTSAERPAMLDFDPTAVDSILVGDEYDNSALLERAGEHWRLPELGDLPADRKRVEALLGALARGGRDWPVAATATARQRFRVAEYFYQRRIDLALADGSEHTVFLGTSPGFRHIHARNRAQGAIYSILLNAFDAPATGGGWLDPHLLQIRAPLGIVSDSYSLRLENGAWVSGTGGTPDADELELLLAALRNLQVKDLAAEDLQRELAAAEADLVLVVNSLGGEDTLELFTHGEQHYILSSRFPFFFALPGWDYDQLTAIDLGLISGQAPPRN
ncbi:MAG: hypothetical protein CME59_08460 [Halioglobus sp.]|nr:hypothetical protein [Halioglobus sp.]